MTRQNQHSLATTAADVLEGVCPRERIERGLREHCQLPEGHTGPHSMRLTHRLIWERAHQDALLDKNCIVRPKDGDWNNLAPANLECVTRRDHWRDIYAEPSHKQKRGWLYTQQGWEKRCTKCHVSLPVEQFDDGRRVCKACRRRYWQERHRKSHRASAFRFRGQEFNLGNLGEPVTDQQRQDALRFVAALLDEQFIAEADGDMAEVERRWLSLAERLSK